MADHLRARQSLRRRSRPAPGSSPRPLPVSGRRLAGGRPAGGAVAFRAGRPGETQRARRRVRGAHRRSRRTPLDRYTITDLRDKDGTWTADTLADLCSGLRARGDRTIQDVDNRPGMSDALEEMCDALKAGQCIGDPRADGIDRPHSGPTAGSGSTATGSGTPTAGSSSTQRAGWSRRPETSHPRRAKAHPDEGCETPADRRPLPRSPRTSGRLRLGVPPPTCPTPPPTGGSPTGAHE